MPPQTPHFRVALSSAFLDQSRIPSAAGRAPALSGVPELAYRGAHVALVPEGVPEARLSPAPAGLPPRALRTDAGGWGGGRGCGASRPPFMTLARPGFPGPRMHVPCGTGKTRPSWARATTVPIVSSHRGRKSLAVARILLGKVLHVPAQCTVWEPPAAGAATASARFPEDDGVAQETGPQGAAPRGLSIGTEVAGSNPCHSPRRPRSAEAAPRDTARLSSEARKPRSGARSVCPTTQQRERGLRPPLGSAWARGPARAGWAAARARVLSSNSTELNYLLRSHFKSVIALRTKLFLQMHPEYNLSQTVI